MAPAGETSETRKRGASAGAAGRLPPVGFWSYARQDDQLSDGRLTRLRALLMQELQQQYGREQIRLFQDAETIPHGSDWEREIKRALDDATFFIPIITPNFIQSEWCGREVELFLEREQTLLTEHPGLKDRSRIFPILFIGIDDVDPENPEVLAALQKLQWFDFRRFRHRSFDDAEVREVIADLAANMRALLRAKVDTAPKAAPAPAEPPAPPPEPTVVAEPAPPPAAPPRQLRVGDQLNHIFEVKRFIKAGGMGQVFEGANAMTGERVAIKALLPALAEDPKIAALFQREAMTLTRLNHEALVQYRVLAKEPQLGLLYIVTEYVDGIELADALGKTGASEADLRRLLERLASGLAAAHRLGAIHRDISPDNVMLPGGDINEAKIIDFGIAKDLGGALPTLIGDGFAGKLNHVAPEQLGEHGGAVGPWTDVYSLALVILAVARGEKVDMSGSFADAIRKRREAIDLGAVPEGLRPLLADMLRADPETRLRSMEAVLARLKAPAAPPPIPERSAAPVAAAPAPAPVPPAPPADVPRPDGDLPVRRPLWLWLALGGAVLAVALFLLLRPRPAAEPDPLPPAAPVAAPVQRAPVAVDPKAWLYGRWGLEGDCSVPVTLAGDATHVIRTFDGRTDPQVVTEASAQLIVTRGARYERQPGDRVRVTETGFDPYIVTKCR